MPSLGLWYTRAERALMRPVLSPIEPPQGFATCVVGFPLSRGVGSVDTTFAIRVKYVTFSEDWRPSSVWWAIDPLDAVALSSEVANG